MGVIAMKKRMVFGENLSTSDMNYSEKNFTGYGVTT